MTTRDKVLQIRAEQPNAHAAQIAEDRPRMPGF